MARAPKGGKNCRVFSPAECFFTAVDTTSTGTFTGTAAIDISEFNNIILGIVFTSGSVAGHVRVVPVDAAGNDLAAIAIRAFNIAVPLVFGGAYFIQMGPSGGWLLGGDGTAVTQATTIVGLDRFKIQVQITTGAAGTMSAHLFAKNGG